MDLRTVTARGLPRYSSAVIFLAACAASPVVLAPGGGITASHDSVAVWDTAEEIPGETGEDPVDSGDSAEPDDGVEHLYVEGMVHEITLTLSNDGLDDLRRHPDRYTTAGIDIDGEEFTVGVHIKGSSTWTELNDKPSFKVDAEFVEDGAEVMGHSKFNLHNQVLDPMMMSEALTYGFWRDAGLPAARLSYAHLTINKSDYGVYTVVEPPTREFLKIWFDEPNGNMYENSYQDCDFDAPSCFEKEQDDEGNDDAIDALCADAVVRGDAWDDAFLPHMDHDRFFDFLAMEILLGHWDSYSYDRSNYRLYHQPVADNWAFIPWSADLSFAYRPWSYPHCNQYAVNPDDYIEGLVAARCHNSESCLHELATYVTARADWFETLDAVGRLQEVHDLIKPYVADDPRKHYSLADFEEHAACVEDLLATRPAEVRAWAALH